MSSEPSFRELTAWERQILDRLVQANFPGRDEVAEQMKNCLVRTLDEHGCLEFDIRTDLKVPIVRGIPVEAEGRDDDGVQICVLLHVVDGKVKELEIFKVDGSPMLRMPKASELDVFVLPPRKLPLKLN